MAERDCYFWSFQSDFQLATNSFFDHKAKWRFVIDLSFRYMYFSDMDIFVPRIERAHLDGTNRETIVAYWLYVPLINSITIDFAENRLLWLDTQDNSIMSANLDGSDEEVHSLFYQNMAPDDVDLLGDTVFFSDVHSHSIERINKTTAKHLLNFGWLSNNDVYGLAVFDSSRQPQGMKNCSLSFFTKYCHSYGLIFYRNSENSDAKI